MWLLRRLAILAITAPVLLRAAEQPRRLAFLLGTGKYAHLPGIDRVPDQLKMMRTALERANFDVTVVENATQLGAVTEAVPAFAAKIREGDICFIYFSGYMTQAQDDNYLLPSDFDPSSKDDLSVRGSSLIGLQQSIDEKKPGIQMFVIEMERLGSQFGVYSRGPTYPSNADIKQILFAFAFSPNASMPELAGDKGGLFTKALAASIDEIGLTLDQVFGRVRLAVGTESGDKQDIYYVSNVTKAFYFHLPVKQEPDPIRQLRYSVSNGRLDRQEYVHLEAGTFKMGCAEEDTKCHSEEKPQHPVTISHDFWIGRNETTVTAYQHYVDQNKKERKMPPPPFWETKKERKQLNDPITEVSWDEAEAFCEWAGGRLPTEAEWEYAARAGKENRINPTEEESRDKANFSGTSGNDTYQYTAPVRSFDKNEFNLYDMSGNVWEWCLDWFAKDYFAVSPAVDPKGPPSGKDHVVRGGSWDSDRKEYLRISYRTPMRTSNKVGFRCVMESSRTLDTGETGR